MCLHEGWRRHVVPLWKDVSPRFGAAFGVSGDGKTAVKLSFGRYVAAEGVNQTRLNNPVQTSVNTATRAWGDTNGNFIPDCDLASVLANGECAAVSPATFGQPRIVTRYAEDTLVGWGSRGYNWQSSGTVQRELARGVSINVGYFRTWYGNFLTTGLPLGLQASGTFQNLPGIPNAAGHARDADLPDAGESALPGDVRSIQCAERELGAGHQHALRDVMVAADADSGRTAGEVRRAVRFLGRVGRVGVPAATPERGHGDPSEGVSVSSRRGWAAAASA